MWLLAAFIGIPLIEIGLFIQVGGLLGLWPTLLIVVLTAILGTSMVRTQGLAALANIQTSINRLDNPAEPLAHGAMILVSGVLLLTPGFFTDALGFALLVPGIRVRVFAFLRSRVNIQHATMNTAGQAAQRNPSGPDVIDGEFREVDPDSIPPRRTDRPSRWTRDDR
ncbi:FxsA family protein [Meridianimarinicoccus aquatilis]|uniref:FxsA family protein n=1 Tax=Meridianimarinicoccus aquatilis TaxID=2552766 RepID=A0A4R6AZS9_9RHOB|nr:FxsA family protein [Fluviibacterium aquatile]TDL89304.1 FxsA family protein [Fluviibacterium aquatile]